MYFNEQKNTNIDKEIYKHKILNNSVVKKIMDKAYILNNRFFKYGLIVLGIIILFFVTYFSFFYNPIKYYLDLNGNNDIVIYQGMEFDDPGYEAYDSKGNNYNEQVVVYGSVDSDIVGEYILTYEFMDVYASRVVTVLETDKDHRTYLILHGDKTMYLEKGNKFVDPMADVVDSTDRNLVNELKVDGYVDENTSGIYKINYSVTNSVGVTLTSTRTVVVMGLDDVSINYSSEYTNNNVEVEIGVLSNFFHHVVLPDNSVNYNKYITYAAPENGLYRIYIYGVNGNVQTKDFYIDNFD